ncbi:hypothetical protein [Paraburkholderia sp. DGU8]|uniref:hypothetical protein n=1 Tax=Paraburkholderia sp. DGU8 TaxID=3161997 RepID=UPI003466146B
MTDTGFWLCIRCRQEIPTKLVAPGIDDFGLYFICPFCERRNELESLGRQRGALVLRQTGK